MAPIADLNNRPGSRASVGAVESNAGFERPSGKIMADMKYIIKDVFTTYGGDWEPGGSNTDKMHQLYDIPRWARDAYYNGLFSEAGADHHLFTAVIPKEYNGGSMDYWQMVSMKPGSLPTIIQETGKEIKSGWVNEPMFNGFNPEDTNGYWRTWIGFDDNSEVFIGGGLPNGHHVSTFVVFQEIGDAGNNDDIDDDDPPVKPPPVLPEQFIEVFVVGPTKITINNPDNEPLSIFIP